MNVQKIFTHAHALILTRVLERRQYGPCVDIYNRLLDLFEEDGNQMAGMLASRLLELHQDVIDNYDEIGRFIGHDQQERQL